VSLLASGIDVLCAAMSDFGDLATDEKEPPTSGVPITRERNALRLQSVASVTRHSEGRLSNVSV
jgi:hypothetical protein